MLKLFRRCPALGFVLGVLVDIVTLRRIDNRLPLFQQGIYLALLTAVLCLDFVSRERRLRLAESRLWSYREGFIHFLFGSLLSAFTIFYFKSASLLGSSLFFLLLCGLLIANELPAFRKQGPWTKFALLGLCVASYLGYLVPILVGRLGREVFLVSMGLAALVLATVGHVLGMATSRLKSLREMLVPSVGALALFVALDLAGVLPPVPLAVKFMGIYHGIDKANGRYVLWHERPWWRVWENGDQAFRAQPGDSVFCFARIFSPTGFQERVRMHWLFRDEREGWKSVDLVPLQVLGGRDEGFRGFSRKLNYWPGEWRVQVETEDGREIGRIRFTVRAGGEIFDNHGLRFVADEG